MLQQGAVEWPWLEDVQTLVTQAVEAEILYPGVVDEDEDPAIDSPADDSEADADALLRQRDFQAEQSCDRIAQDAQDRR